MALNTTNSTNLALMNQYKLNLAANEDVVRDISPVPNEASENEDYQVMISDEAQQLAQQEKVRSGYDVVPPAAEETDAALNRSRFELTTRNMSETTGLAVQNQATGRYGIEVVA